MIKYTKEEQKEHRQEWIKALRSGNYKQYGSKLKTGDSFCVLGVACDISGLHEWEDYIYNDRRSVLPHDVMDYYGIKAQNGSYIEDFAYTSLIYLDSTKISFDDIADVIESEPRGLLVA